MLKNDLEEEFVAFYRWVSDYIRVAQTEDDEIWEWYCKLCDRWIRERDKQFGKGRYGNPYSMFREYQGANG